MTTTGTAVALLLQRAAEVAGMADDAVPSPCVSVCRMDDQRAFCTGCLRTIPEIAGWSRADAADKRRVWRAIALRAAAQTDPARSTGDITP